jgi:SpoVT / AbrB like domain.
MAKTLTRTGNSLAVILDRPLLKQTGIDETTPLEISTDGDVIVISPVRGAKARRKLKDAMDEINQQYAGVFRRLAE